jgi:hypothetical protein
VSPTCETADAIYVKRHTQACDPAGGACTEAASERKFLLLNRSSCHEQKQFTIWLFNIAMENHHF